MSRDRTNVTALLEDLPSFSRQNRGGIFLVIKGPDRGESVRLEPDHPVYFGSSPSCELVLSDKTVSRKHMMAELAGDEVIVMDCGSTNGCFIQGSRFEKISIGFGAEVKLGRTVVKFLPDEEVVEPEPSRDTAFGTIVGADTKMRQLFNLLTDVAATNATVLIEGETGTGKELIAEEVHNHSPRRDGPFVVFDCGSVPRELIESMLFGHVKGSFTGAITDRKGAFAEAHGGTIFLDEIGEMALDLQPSLLRVLDKRAVRKVGSNTYEKIDVRVVAATNRDLRAEVAKKTFREDLYYRLAVIRLTVPPLRERGSDIPLLVQHFMAGFGAQLKISPEDMSKLVRHSWPGNVRELRNVMERACLLSRGDHVNIDDALTQEAGGPQLGIRTDLPFKEAKGQLVEMFEREYIEDLMRRHKMNLSAAAREAQIDRKHLRELIRKYGLDPRAKLDGDEEEGGGGGDD
jgi:two-component system, NtrC family, nitrogen regulation response regulator GlnG